MKLIAAKQINKSRELGILLNSSLLQRRIIYSCLAIMNPIIPHLKGLTNDEVREWLDQNPKEARLIRTYVIDLNDFAAIWNIGGNSLTDKIESAIGYNSKTGSQPEIMKLCFKHTSDESKLKFVNVISSVELDRCTGTFSIELTDTILPYLINLTSYSTIPFKATVGFKSQYSFTMLEYLLRRYVGQSTYPIIDLSIDSLHQILDISHLKTYQSWTQLKRKILDRIEADFSTINGGGYDLSFEPVKERKGRGQPKVIRVLIKFNDVGFKSFINSKENQNLGLSSTKNILTEAQQALKHYELEQQKQRDIKTSQEEFGF